MVLDDRRVFPWRRAGEAFESGAEGEGDLELEEVLREPGPPAARGPAAQRLRRGSSRGLGGGLCTGSAAGAVSPCGRLRGRLTPRDG